MRLIFGNKVIRVDILDEKGAIVHTSEKGFTLPKDMSSDDDAIIMIKGKNLPEFDRNTIVSVVTTTKSNDRIQYTGAVTVSMDTQMNIKILQNNDSTVLKERRRFFKIKVNEHGRALFYVRDEKTVRYDEPLALTILDINVGGAFVVCPEGQFLEGDLVCMDLDLFVDNPLNVAARVLRIQRNEDGKIKGYGCEFQGLTAAQEDLISRFIIKTQTETRLKEGEKNSLV